MKKEMDATQMREFGENGSRECGEANGKDGPVPGHSRKGSRIRNRVDTTWLMPDRSDDEGPCARTRNKVRKKKETKMKEEKKTPYNDRPVTSDERPVTSGERPLHERALKKGPRNPSKYGPFDQTR